jgi:hypothetical protein
MDEGFEVVVEVDKSGRRKRILSAGQSKKFKPVVLAAKLVESANGARCTPNLIWSDVGELPRELHQFQQELLETCNWIAHSEQLERSECKQRHRYVIDYLEKTTILMADSPCAAVHTELSVQEPKWKIDLASYVMPPSKPAGSMPTRKNAGRRWHGQRRQSGFRIAETAGTTEAAAVDKTQQAASVPLPGTFFHLPSIPKRSDLLSLSLSQSEDTIPMLHPPPPLYMRQLQQTLASVGPDSTQQTARGKDPDSEAAAASAGHNPQSMPKGNPKPGLAQNSLQLMLPSRPPSLPHIPLSVVPRMQHSSLTGLWLAQNLSADETNPNPDHTTNASHGPCHIIARPPDPASTASGEQSYYTPPTRPSNLHLPTAHVSAALPASPVAIPAYLPLVPYPIDPNGLGTSRPYGSPRNATSAQSPRPASQFPSSPTSDPKLSPRNAMPPGFIRSQPGTPTVEVTLSPRSIVSRQAALIDCARSPTVDAVSPVQETADALLSEANQQKTTPGFPSKGLTASLANVGAMMRKSAPQISTPTAETSLARPLKKKPRPLKQQSPDLLEPALHGTPPWSSGAMLQPWDVSKVESWDAPTLTCSALVQE